MSAQGKVQFNILLPPELIRRTKRRAMETGMSLSVLVERALEQVLRLGVSDTDPEPMTLRTFVLVSDIQRSLSFYTSLGFSIIEVPEHGRLARVRLGETVVILHRAAELPPTSRDRVSLVIVSESPLEDVAGRLQAAGLAHQPIIDVSYGRTMLVTDPDGLRLAVEEYL